MAEIKLSLDFPPNIFCTADDCEVRVGFKVNNTQDLTCSGVDVPQIVLEQKSSKSSCDARFTMENWREEMEISVFAVMDSIKDGEQTAVVEIESEATSGNMSYSDVFMDEEGVKVKPKCHFEMFIF